MRLKWWSLSSLLAVVHKPVILDLESTDAMQVFALGAVCWLLRDRDRRWRRGTGGRDAAGDDEALHHCTFAIRQGRTSAPSTLELTRRHDEP